ncbi:MAG TPA: hypothetical protein VNL94_06110, partial [Candidatus Binatia bacterium]|nr:hypothetical protein [Candidatus Binatia bacterium]
MSSSPPLRGRRGWERRLAERDREDARPSVERPAFDSAEAEIEAHVVATARLAEAAAPRRQGAGRRIPNLAGLPLLLDGTGALEGLRERLGRPSELRTVGRHAGVTSVPHGAKSYLAAALALVAGERICW